MLAILDVNVLVSAAVTPNGPADRLLGAVRAGALALVVSPLLLPELSTVLHRPKFRRRLSMREADEYVDAVRRLATFTWTGSRAAGMCGTRTTTTSWSWRG